MSLDKPSNAEIKNTGEMRFAIVAAQYNAQLVDALVTRGKATLLAAGVPEDSIDIKQVPGSNELPYVVNLLAFTGEYDCILALGVVIAGDTHHHDVIAHSTANVLQQIATQTEIPVINGILTTENREQAEARSLGDIDRGAEFANAAIVMAAHKIALFERLNKLDLEVGIRNKRMENN